MDLAQLPQPAGWSVAGRAAGDVSLQGTWARPRAFGSVTLSAARVQPPQGALLALAEGSLELQGDRAVVNGFRATVAGGTVLLSGRVPVAALLAEARARRFGVAAGEEADLRLTWEGVETNALLEALRPDRPSRVSATLAGEARLQGTLATWRQAHGDVTVSPTQVQIQDLQLEVSPWTMRLEAGRLSTDWLVARAEGTVFRAAGEVDLADRTFEATGHGDLDLRALSPLLEEASLTGLGEFDLDVSGPVRDPVLVGSIRVKDGTLRVRDLRQPLTAINGLVTLRDNVLQMEGVSGTLGGGRLDVTGGARVAGLALTDVHVALSGDDLGIRYPVGGRGGRAREILEDLKARIDVDLTLTGRTRQLLLAGTMNVERSLYDSDIFWEEGLLAPEAPPPAGPQRSRFLRRVALDIAVTTEHPLLVRNNLAELEAEGSVTLRGSAAELAPFGRFEIRPGGKAFLQGREFSIESGSLIYEGTTDPDDHGAGNRADQAAGRGHRGDRGGRRAAGPATAHPAVEPAPLGGRDRQPHRHRPDQRRPQQRRLGGGRAGGGPPGRAVHPGGVPRAPGPRPGPGGHPAGAPRPRGRALRPVHVRQAAHPQPAVHLFQQPERPRVAVLPGAVRVPAGPGDLAVGRSGTSTGPTRTGRGSGCASAARRPPGGRPATPPRPAWRPSASRETFASTPGWASG